MNLKSTPKTYGKNYRFVIAIALCLVAFIAVFFQFQLQPVSNEIKDALGGLSDSSFSAMFTAPMYPAIFMSIISGLIVDRVGGRWPMFVCLALGTIGLWGRVFAQRSYAGMFLGMFVVGFAATLGNSTNGKMFGGWFSPEKCSVCIGLYMACSSLGSTIANLSTPHLTRTAADGKIDMTVPFIIAAVAVTVALIFWFLFYRDGKGVAVSRDSSEQKESILTTIKVIFKQKDMVLGCLADMCCYGALQSMATFMGIIMADKGAQPTQIGAIGAMVTVGMFIGNFFVPQLVNRSGKLRLSLISMGAVGTVMLILISAM